MYCDNDCHIYFLQVYIYLVRWNVSSVAAAYVNEPFLRVREVSFFPFLNFSILGSFLRAWVSSWVYLEIFYRNEKLNEMIFGFIKNGNFFLLLLTNKNSRLFFWRLLRTWRHLSFACLVEMRFSVGTYLEDKCIQFNNFSLALNSSKLIAQHTA